MSLPDSSRPHVPEADPEALRALSVGPSNRDAMEALGEVMIRTASSECEAPPRRRFFVKPILGVMLGLLTSYLWIGNPSWLPSFDEPAPPQEYQEASMRFAMYLQYQRIEQFRLAHDRLPVSLDEAGSAIEGIDYRRVDAGRYCLTTTHMGTALALQSTDSMEVFLGNRLGSLGLTKATR